MRRPESFPEELAEGLEDRLHEATTKAEFQTAQCLWLRHKLGLNATEIGLAIGWHPSSVRRVQSQFLRHGQKALARQGRGGARRRCRLDPEKEREVLAPFSERQARGEKVAVDEVKQQYEKVLGHKMSPSSIYRILNDCGWRFYNRLDGQQRENSSDTKSQSSQERSTAEIQGSGDNSDERPSRAKHQRPLRMRSAGQKLSPRLKHNKDQQISPSSPSDHHSPQIEARDEA